MSESGAPLSVRPTRRSTREPPTKPHHSICIWSYSLFYLFYLHPSLAITTANSYPAPSPVPARPMPTVQSLRASLEELGYSTSGNKDTLRQRLRKARKAPIAPLSTDALGSSASQPTERPWTPAIHTFLVLDIEATCIRRRYPPPEALGTNIKKTLPGYDYPNEIIEFPVLVLHWNHETREYEEVDRFHRFVRPLWRPKLSTYCKSLTGVEQDVIDQASTWPTVLWELFHFLNAQGLLGQRSRHDTPDKFRLAEGVCWATHGPEDLAGFVPKQSWIAAQALHDLYPLFGDRGARGLPPLWLRGPLLDIREAFCHLHRLASKPSGSRPNRSAPRPHRSNLTIVGILRQLGLTFEGRQHSGICDTQNLAAIMATIARRVRDGGQPVGSNSASPSTVPNGGTGGEQDPVLALTQALDDTHLSFSSPPSSSPSPTLGTSPTRAFPLPARPQDDKRQKSPGRPREPPGVLAPLSVSPWKADAVLLPNTDYSTFGNAPYWWMVEPGQVAWPHPPET